MLFSCALQLFIIYFKFIIIINRFARNNIIYNIFKLQNIVMLFRSASGFNIWSHETSDKDTSDEDTSEMETIENDRIVQQLYYQINCGCIELRSY